MLFIATEPTDATGFNRAGMLSLLRSHSQIVPVADATAQAQHISDLATAGVTVSASNPAMLWRQDTKRFMVYDGTDWYSLPTEGDTSWQSPTLVNGWSGTVKVRRTVGGIELRISALDAASATAGQITTLPAGWRPTDVGDPSVRFFIHTADTAPVIRRGQIESSGAVLVYDYDTTKTYYGSVFASVVS